jgi:hypothetical protein
MSSRLFARFDPTALGASLELSRSNTVLTYTGSASISRTARLTDPKDAGIWYAEFLVWGDPSISNLVSIGAVKASASLSTYVGGDAYGYGYRIAEGQIHHSGSSIESVTAGAKGQIVGMLLDATAQTLLIELDGVPLTTVSLPDSGPWALAGSMGGTTGYDLWMMANTGQRAFEHGRSVRLGWFATRESLGMYRFADRPWLTAPTDDPPNARYRGLLMEKSKLLLRGALTFWPMRSGGSTVQSSSGTLRVGNATRELNVLATGDIRDAQVRILEIPDGGDYSDAVQIADLVVDSISADNDDSLDIKIGDVLDQLDAALQDRLIRPDSDESSADQVWPVSLGCCRSITPPLIAENPPDDTDAAARYALHDGAVLGLGYVRDGGYPFDYAALPIPDYWLDSLGRLMLARAPALALTVDVSSVGGDVPGGPTDLLSGDGDFGSGTNWTLTNGTISGGKLTLTNTTPGIYNITAYAKHNTFTMTAGESYRIEIEIEFFAGGLPTYGQFPSVLLTGSATGTAPFPTREQSYWERAYVGVYTAVVSPGTNTALFIALTGTQAGFDQARVKGVHVYEINTDPVDDESLVPITLEAFLREIIEVRAGWSPDSWSAADAAAIDVATGYSGVGFHAREPTTRRQALQDVLDSYCACLWRDDAGVIRITRLVAPETEVSSGIIDKAQIKGDVKMTQDLAPGLTTQARGRKNWHPLVEGEVSSDTADVPLSMRARLKADFRINAAYAGALPDRYAHARNVDPKGFLLDKRPDVGAEIDYVNGELYSVPRNFYEVPVKYDSYERGQIKTLVHEDAKGRPIHGLSAEVAKHVMIVDVERDPIVRSTTLICWG